MSWGCGPIDAGGVDAGHHRPGGPGRPRAKGAPKKLPALRAALQGRFRAHHAFLLTQILSKLDTLDAIIADCSMQLEAQLAPFRTALTQLMTIPGVKRRTAEVLMPRPALT